MAKGNPLLHIFNEINSRLFEAGLFESWVNDFMSSSSLDDHLIDNDDTKFSDFTTNELHPVYSPVSLIQLQVVFHVLLIGNIMNTFVSFVEVLYNRACIPVATSTTLDRTQRDH